ncbi:hypothetical protein R5R35_004314 [Gryllus longicercus]|uniref:GBD/FH3 domain-containing protein n=1 Tax=Gryllus longicercus TaxID=2509291 RepID=A0AAN9VSG5_9ORTH
MGSRELWVQAAQRAGRRSGRRERGGGGGNQWMQDERAAADPAGCVALLCSGRPAALGAVRRALDRADGRWRLHFLRLDGLSLLLEALGHLRPSSVADAVCVHECVAAIRAAGSTRSGLAFLAARPRHTRQLADALASRNPTVRLQVLELLCAVSLTSERGHRLVLDALTHLAARRGERHAFQPLLAELAAADTAVYRATVLALLNCLLLGQPHVAARHRLRQTLLGLGLTSQLETLHADRDEKVRIQLQVFEKNQQADEDLLGPEQLSTQNVFDNLFCKLADSPHSMCLHALLLNLMQLDPSDSRNDGVWAALEETSAKAARNLINNSRVQPTPVKELSDAAECENYDSDSMSVEDDGAVNTEKKKLLSNYVTKRKKVKVLQNKAVQCCLNEEITDLSDCSSDKDTLALISNKVEKSETFESPTVLTPPPPPPPPLPPSLTAFCSTVQPVKSPPPPPTSPTTTTTTTPSSLFATISNATSTSTSTSSTSWFK